MPDGYAACEVRAKFSAKQPLSEPILCEYSPAIHEGGQDFKNLGFVHQRVFGCVSVPGVQHTGDDFTWDDPVRDRRWELEFFSHFVAFQNSVVGRHGLWYVGGGVRINQVRIFLVRIGRGCRRTHCMRRCCLLGHLGYVHRRTW